MKKFLTIAVFVLMAGTINLATIAETTEKEEGYISVSASSTQEVSPNQVEITISIETSDRLLQNASAENKIIADKVYSSLKALLINSDYLKTQNYSASPVYIYKDNKKFLDKYTVSNSVVVRTKNIQLVPKLIDTAIAQGATGVSNLQFSVSNYDDACNDLLSNLTKKAYSQASTIANSISSKIVGVKSISSTCNPENNSRPYMFMAKGAMDSVAAATPVESGKVKVYANIDASFYVK